VPIVVSGAHRDAAFDAASDGRGIGDVVAHQRRLDGDHAAADIDAHGGRNNGAFRGEHRADRRPLPEMAIGHHRHVLENKRHGCGVFNLLQRLLLDTFGTGEEHGSVVQSEHGADSMIAPPRLTLTNGRA
jgi:hypothetical protein